MKSIVLFAVVIGTLCVTCAVASPFKKESGLRTARSAIVNQQEESVKSALVQLYLRMLENEVKEQDYSDEDRAKIESIFSKMKNFFHNLGDKVKNSFSKFGEKVKNAFRRG